MELQDTCNLLSFAFGGKIPKTMAEAIHCKSSGHARDAIKMAELTVLSDITTIEDLHNQIGLSYGETEELITQVLNRSLTWEQSLQLLKIQDAQMLDNIVDRVAINRNEFVLRNYAELLKIRLLRKDYKVTLTEQVLHLLSIFNKFRFDTT